VRFCEDATIIGVGFFFEFYFKNNLAFSWYWNLIINLTRDESI